MFPAEKALSGAASGNRSEALFGERGASAKCRQRAAMYPSLPREILPLSLIGNNCGLLSEPSKSFSRSGVMPWHVSSMSAPYNESSSSNESLILAIGGARREASPSMHFIGAISLHAARAPPAHRAGGAGGALRRRASSALRRAPWRAYLARQRISSRARAWHK